MRITKFFRKINIILFLTLQGCFLLILTVIASVYNFNWENVFDQYQQDQLTVNAYKIMDDMRSNNLIRGPFTDEQKQWLLRRTTLYGIYIRYRDETGKETWYDSIRQMDEKNFIVKVFPLVAKGESQGILQVVYQKAMNDIDPNILEYQKTMRIRSAALFALVAVFSVGVSLIVAKLLSTHLQKLQVTASEIRQGKWDVKAPVRGPEEVRQLALTLNELAADLKKQEDWRHTLMEDFTHELRTPLTSVLSQLEAMIDGIYEMNRDWLEQVYEELIRLSRLMNDMERLSEAEAARFSINIKRTDMTQLTQRVYRNFVPLAKSKGVKLQFVDNHVPCHAEVDRDKIVQVVSNIVSNAIKYTEMGGTVKLGISYDSEYTVIFCEDTGIGISKEDLPYIFNRLYRADKSRSRFTGGVGLGLSIAKALIEAHDGSFEVESELGKGSVFQIRIPNEYKAP